jgi:hypothetical protein
MEEKIICKKNNDCKLLSIIFFIVRKTDNYSLQTHYIPVRPDVCVIPIPLKRNWYQTQTRPDYAAILSASTQRQKEAISTSAQGRLKLIRRKANVTHTKCLLLTHFMDSSLNVFYCG